MSIEINILAEPASLPQTAVDTTWAGSEIPVREPEGYERVMLSEDKIFVVLAVVLIIWMGIVWMIYRTDRQLKRLEDEMASSADV
jgi:CcmD family protein